MSERALDLVVVGAGSAGAALAALAAERGLRTLVLERKTLDRAGASWINDVPGWMFDEAGVARPSGDELHTSHSLTMIAGFDADAPRLRAEPKDFLGVDMRKLVARLEERAMRAGADLRGGAHVSAIEEDGEAMRVHSSLGTHRARFVVDASGLAGIDALGPLHGRANDVCTAAQEVREVRDAEGARAFLSRYRATEGDVLVFTGVAGGYSIINVRLHGDTVFLLTGSIPAEGHPSGKALLDRFVANEPWIGERIFGGARAIPLSYPRPIVARGNVASLGDAASQVFSAHGSGTGAGLVAARMLADALALGRPGDYQHRYQRRYGLLLATHDLFRRFTQRLDADDVRVLIREGILSPKTIEATLAQRFPRPELAWMTHGRTLAKHPRIGRGLASLAARTGRLAAIYAAHPADAGRQAAWAERVAAAMA
jgi:flavin-dependent dehydrogenase